MLIAQLNGMSVAQVAILVIVAAGIIAIVFAVLQTLHVQVPAFIIRILWIIFAVVIGVAAVKLIMSIW